MHTAIGPDGIARQIPLTDADREQQAIDHARHEARRASRKRIKTPAEKLERMLKLFGLSVPEFKEALK